MGRLYGTDLSLRNPNYIRRQMVNIELASRLYFRAHVSGLENIPSTDPVIFVGNHSGGVTTPDTILFAQAFWSHFGAERPVYALAQKESLRIPVINTHLMKLGCVAATASTAYRTLERDASILIYPGAGHEAYRPFWRSRVIDLNGRSAYIRLAMRFKAPIVPVVSLGGHETFVALNDGEAIADLLGLRRLGIERLPLTLALPWGISLGLAHHIPWPSRINIRCGEPISLLGFTPGDARDPSVVAHCHNHVEARLQALLEELARERHEPKGAQTVTTA